MANGVSRPNDYINEDILWSVLATTNPLVNKSSSFIKNLQTAKIILLKRHLLINDNCNFEHTQKRMQKCSTIKVILASVLHVHACYNHYLIILLSIWWYCNLYSVIRKNMNQNQSCHFMWQLLRTD